MKFNYTPRITKLKLVDINTKGTRAKAVFTFSSWRLRLFRGECKCAKDIGASALVLSY
jgi:hypothetical protein